MFKTSLKSKLMVAVMLMFGIAAFMSCEKEDVVMPVVNDGVVETFRNNMVSFVDSVQSITPKHYLYQLAINSPDFKKSNIQDINSIAGVYYYTNGYASILISDVKEENVFAYIIQLSNLKTIEV